MNLQPINDVTATLIYDVLEVAGHAMIEAYGSAFKKLLLALCSEFFPKIQMVTKPGRSSPVARLEEFLRKTISSGEIKKPESQLKPGFL